MRLLRGMIVSTVGSWGISVTMSGDECWFSSDGGVGYILARSVAVGPVNMDLPHH